MRLTLEIIKNISFNRMLPTKLYKYQIFLSWRLFSSFADFLKILGGGIYFKFIGSFLVAARRWCRDSFSLLK